MNVAPKNKKELRECVIRNVCSHRKRKATQHVRDVGWIEGSCM